ncbi:hypothetical protein D3C73_1473640 [compost metagenome]
MYLVTVQFLPSALLAERLNKFLLLGVEVAVVQQMDLHQGEISGVDGFDQGVKVSKVVVLEDEVVRLGVPAFDSWSVLHR